VPLHYLDTSSVAKSYLPEAGSRWMNDLIEAEPIVISSLVLVEVASEFGRRMRESVLTAAQRDAAYALFLQDTQRYLVLGLVRATVREAATLCLTAPPSLQLRTLDALHLVTARRAFGLARRRGQSIGALVSADQRLLRIAAMSGLPIMNPEDHP